jgi:hypothetical protein
VWGEPVVGAGIDRGVEVLERLCDRFDPLVVRARLGVGGLGCRQIPVLDRRNEWLRVRHEEPDLGLDVCAVVLHALVQ